MIIIQDLKKGFGNKIIIRNFSLHFPHNTKIGIVGPNGAGKTTFLNILTKIEEPDDGKIIVPKDCILGYLPQSPNENPLNTILEECISGHGKLCELQEKLNAALKNMEVDYTDKKYEEYEKIEQEFSNLGGYALEAQAKGILVGLGFETAQFNQDPQALSGGWRMRLELAKLLLNEPNFLILDEPTNHLDLPSLSWLEGYLRSFKGTLLFVSHDREFLNNIAEKILHISNGNFNLYNGDFDSFVEQREAKTDLMKNQKESLKKKQDHLQTFVDRFKSKATKAKQAQSKVKMIERLRELESRIDIDDTDKRSTFKMEVEQQSGKIVLELKNFAIGYNSKILSKNINLKITRGSKIAIIGANGIGKSTLLKTIVQEIQSLDGEMIFGHNVNIGYYAQDYLDILDPKLNALDNILNLTKNLNYLQARALLGCLLITKDDVKKIVGILSGGEKSKIAIAALLAQKNNFLILDEPTNHLDMSSAEALASALQDYCGTILTVSHNRAFIDSFATHIFQMDKNNIPELITIN